VPEPELTALLVDWGGVLTTNVFASFEAFCIREGLPPETAREAFRTDPVARAALVGLETGVLSEVEFELRLAPVLGVDPRRLIDRLNAEVAPNERMLAAVARARDAGLATGLISNSWGLNNYGPELLKLFDGVVISGHHGIRKPAPEMYEMGARSVGVAPDRCVYVDDIGGNLKPARDLGMTTVHHVDTSRTIDELSRLFGIDLR
jgi:epoxide hydrolase-like predicted phosphatase